jgi:hypothetical protein
MAASTKAAIRLVLSPETAGRFSARLDSMGEVIVTGTRQPLVDGARMLLAQGYDPCALLTMRHEGKACESFQPLPIGKWAGWTYEESGTKPLRRVRWMPFPTAAGTQKSGSEPSVVPLRARRRRIASTAMPAAATAQHSRGGGMMAAFQEMATAWAAAGIVPLPITADGKRPLVKQPDTFGRRGALQLTAKPRFANAAVGFWCGHFNRLTVADVDSAADSELQYALDTFGQTPVIVRTASGKHHAYYRHNGGRRQIKPDKAHPIDILGEGGFCVAPPSVRSDGERYEFVRGGLSDLANLPTMRPGALQIPEPIKPRVNPSVNSSPIGKRNDTVFRLALALALAHGAGSQEELLAQARKANAEFCVSPNDDAEVVRTVRKVWEYKMAGRLMVPGIGSAIILQAASLDRVWTLAMMVWTVSRSWPPSVRHMRDYAIALLHLPRRWRAHGSSGRGERTATARPFASFATWASSSRSTVAAGVRAIRPCIASPTRLRV